MGLLNKIGSLVGLGGGQGEYYRGAQLQNEGTEAQASLVKAQQSTNVQKLIQDMQSGKISLAEAMAKTSNPQEQAALASSPIGSTLVASEQLRTDPLTMGQFGKGGSLAQAMQQETDIANRGYSLQPEDIEAYGQASGNVARLFGQHENSLAQSLANRGLAAGNSGITQAQFTGLQGNKNEQLGQLQRQIADNRMQSNLQRLAETRNYIQGMTGIEQQALSGIRGANMAGMDQQLNAASSLSGNKNSDFRAQESVNQAAMESKLANKQKSLGDAISGGIFSGVQGGAGALVGGGIGSLGSKKSGEAGAAAGSGVDPAKIASIAALASDVNLKTDIKKYDTTEFLETLNSYEYRYKDEKFGKGKQVGVMAQDVEKVMPSAVLDTPEGKMISVSVIGPMLAAMSDLHKRIKELEGK